MTASNRTKVVALLASVVLSIPGDTGRAAAAESSPNLQFAGNIAYKGGSDIEFQDRLETKTVARRAYRVVRTKKVRCSRLVRCRRGARYKIVRIRPRRVSYTKYSTLEVNKSYAYAGSLTSFAGADPVGLRIVDITDPTAPRLTAFYSCDSNQLDIQVLERSGRSYVLLGLDYPRGRDPKASQCFSDLGISAQSVGVAVVDVTDATSPRGVGFIPLKYGAHNTTLHPGGRYLYVSDAELEGRDVLNDERFYVNGRIQIVDLQDPASPSFVREFDLPPGGSSHDITFNASGTRAYSAALTQTVIMDTSDPANPRFVSVIEDPAINIHHQSDPYSMNGRQYLVITDELFGAAGNGYCPGGGLHIYDVTNERVPIKTSVFVPPIATTFFQSRSFHQCTSHVLRLHPEQGIMTVAWYLAGTWVVDISDPGHFRAIGYGNATATDGRRANTWAAKFHRGYIYTNDLNRGVDVYRYDGVGPEIRARVEPGVGPSTSAPSVNFDLSAATLGRPLFCFDLS